MKISPRKYLLGLVACAAVVLAFSYHAGAGLGDRMVITSTACSGNMCTETTTVYEQRIDGSYVVISTITRSFPRRPVEK